MARTAAGSGFFRPIFFLRPCCRSSVVEHSLGKGEVDSSILSGSTSAFRVARGAKLYEPLTPARRMHLQVQ